MKRNYIAYIAIVIFIVVILLAGFFTPKPLIVYNDRSLDLDTVKKDCENRGGEFNECGPNCSYWYFIEYCSVAAVCSWTCEFNK